MITHWWLYTLPPVSGILRAVFYLGLLVLCLVDSPTPLSSAKIIGKTEPAFYTPVAVLRVLHIRWVRPPVLSFISKLTIALWITAAAGLLQPVTAVLTFLGFAFLHAVNAGALGANHSTHAALYALFCMCFSVSYGFSLDGLLASHIGWPLLVPRDSVLSSGFAPALALVILAYTLFAGGVAKLRYGWRGWRDGSALHFYLRVSAPLARWPWLSRFMIAHPALCAVSAWATLVIELGSVVAIFSSPLRLPLILSWVALHTVILCVMFPGYWIQMWCYLLLLNWPWLISKITGNPAVPPHFTHTGPAAMALTVVGCLVAAALVVVLIVSSELWPFTSVPMYSNGTRDVGQVRLPPREELHPRAARAVRGGYSAWGRAWVDDEFLEDIWVRPADPDAPPHRLFHLLYEQGTTTFVRWSQYAKVIRRLAIEDVVAKKGGQLEHTDDGMVYPGTAFLRRVSPLVRAALPGWESYDALELTCRTTSGDVVLGRAPLAEPMTLERG
jgi:hypothetical protein